MPNQHGHTVIAVDGTSASGKSTLSTRIAEIARAERLEYSLVFRAIGYHMYYACKFDPDSPPPPAAEYITQAADYAKSLNWEEIQRIKDLPDLRSIETSRTTPYFSGLPEILEIVDPVFYQLIDSCPRPVVAEGRTIGRYVYPHADVKLYVDADVMVRAARRTANLTEKGKDVTQESVMQDLIKRDHQDQTREHQPTIPAEDALLVDTGYVTVDETLDTTLHDMNILLAAQRRATIG